MPEGLSPIEVGRELQEHTKEPHQPAGGNRHSRMVQIGEALALPRSRLAYADDRWCPGERPHPVGMIRAGGKRNADLSR